MDFVQHQALKTDSKNHREPNRPFSSKTLASKHVPHKFHGNALCLLIRLDRIHTRFSIFKRSVSRIWCHTELVKNVIWLQKNALLKRLE